MLSRSHAVEISLLFSFYSKTSVNESVAMVFSLLLVKIIAPVTNLKQTM